MKVLVAIDLQNDFIDGTLGTREAQNIVSNTVEIIKDFKGTVIATRDTHHDNYMETSEGKNLPVIHCIEGTPGHDINVDIMKALNENKGLYAIVDKPTFGSTKLVEILKQLDEKEKITSITAIGLCTDICVVSNVLMIKANFPEIEIKVIENSCAGVTPESHNAAITTMRMCQINVA